jgi:hypothetical protein
MCLVRVSSPIIEAPDQSQEGLDSREFRRSQRE